MIGNKKKLKKKKQERINISGKTTEHHAIHIIILNDTIQRALYASIIFI